MRIIWTRHATERQQEWQRRLGITRSEVEAVLANPPQIAQGEAGELVAQAIRENGLLRVAFIQAGEDRKILTLYWTSKVTKYWKGA